MFSCCKKKKRNKSLDVRLQLLASDTHVPALNNHSFKNSELLEFNTARDLEPSQLHSHRIQRKITSVHWIPKEIVTMTPLDH